MLRGRRPLSLLAAPKLLLGALELCLQVDDGARSGAACGVVEAVPDPIDIESGLAPPRPE